jgi:hypothetical protein
VRHKWLTVVVASENDRLNEACAQPFAATKTGPRASVVSPGWAWSGVARVLNPGQDDAEARHNQTTTTGHGECTGNYGKIATINLMQLGATLDAFVASKWGLLEAEGTAVGMSDQPSGEEPRDHASEPYSQDEVERMRERLAFFESFDQLIHENIARSGDLLRQAMDLRESAGQELAAARAEQEQTDLSLHRETLASILADITQLQGQVERLGRRVADSLEDVEANLPPGERTELPPRLPGSESFSSLFLDAPPEYIAFTTPEERAAAIMSEPPPTSTETVEAPSETVAAQEARLDEVNEIEPPSLESILGADISGELSASSQKVQPPPLVEEPAPQVEELPAEPAEPVVTSQSLTLLVHGVPRAATALSLQRYLSQLGQVEAVEPREYAEGVLRLHVAVREPVSITDLRGWKEGAGFEPVHARDDLIEVRLPGASGF